MCPQDDPDGSEERVLFPSGSVLSRQWGSRGRSAAGLSVPSNPWASAGCPTSTAKQRVSRKASMVVAYNEMTRILRGQGSARRLVLTNGAISASGYPSGCARGQPIVITSGDPPERDSPSRAQSRSRARVRDLAEVYTHEREVEAMLDLVPDVFPSEADPGNTDRTFLEPACGHGNFLVAILSRKLRYAVPRTYGRGERFEHRVLRCLASVYGIDISGDNVIEARERMRAGVGEHLAAHDATETTPGFRSALDAILATNVIHADTLADAAEIELVAYESSAGGTFIREWSRPLDPAAREPNLFTLAPRRDQVPLHYSQLARQTEPTVADSAQDEAA